MGWRRMRRLRHKHRFGDNLKPLTEVQVGQQAVIKQICGEQKVVQRLADLGLLPNTTILVVNVAPLNGPVEVVVRDTKLALGREIAENLLVSTE